MAVSADCPSLRTAESPPGCSLLDILGVVAGSRCRDCHRALRPGRLAAPAGRDVRLLGWGCGLGDVSVLGLWFVALCDCSLVVRDGDFFLISRVLPRYAGRVRSLGG